MIWRLIILIALTLPIFACESRDPQVPVKVRDGTNGWQTVEIDLCLAEIVGQLQGTNTTTLSSCCGHGKSDGFIMLGKWNGKEFAPYRIIALTPEMSEEATWARYWKEWDTVNRTGYYRRESTPQKAK